MFILDRSNSIANQYLAELRSVEAQQDRLRFRNNLIRLGKIMAYEISKDLEYHQRPITTPLGKAEVNLIVAEPVLTTILRAGIPFYQGFLEIFDKADSGFIGSYRANVGKMEEIEIESEYDAIPKLEGRIVILIDPMLATGKSLVSAIEQLIKKGMPKHIYLVSVISAPEGIEYLRNNLDLNYSIWTVSLDEHLNNKAYIVPGLGDAGDLAFGPKN